MYILTQLSTCNALHKYKRIADKEGRGGEEEEEEQNKINNGLREEDAKEEFLFMIIIYYLWHPIS